jgi:hypothetical protein
MTKSSSSKKSSSSSSSSSSQTSHKKAQTVKTAPTKQGMATLERFKMEAANEVGVQLQNGYNGNLTAKQAGAIGGRMVKKMVDSYKQGNRS